MAEPARKSGRTPAEWLAWEEQQPERYELVYDEPHMMAGGSARHADIIGNVFTALRQRLGGGLCRTYVGDLKVLHPSGRWTYPDVIVRCGERLDRETGTDDPVIIVEILSPSTERYDDSTKRWLYQEIPALQHLVLVAQDEAKVEVATRTPDGAWRSVFLRGLDQAIGLEALDVELPLAEVYADVDFGAPGDVAQEA
jgi:Uma2 family endonuclease